MAKLCSYCTSQDLKKNNNDNSNNKTKATIFCLQRQKKEESQFYNINFAQINLENLQLIITF